MRVALAQEPAGGRGGAGEAPRLSERERRLAARARGAPL